MEHYSTQKVLELACAAYRTYGAYLKEDEYVYDKEGKFQFVKHCNKTLVKCALGVLKDSNQELEFRPFNLILVPEDTESAEDIRKYFRRYMFSAIQGQNDFEIEVNTLLAADTIDGKKVGYIACLPSVLRQNQARNSLSKKLKSCDDEPLAAANTTLFDKDCEILSVKRSMNFDAWNILAIIDNKIVSWMSKNELNVGAAVIQKLKVKGVGENYQTKKIETRVNYVKAVQ